MIADARERYNADEVRFALTSMVTTVLSALGYPTKGNARRLMSPRCPLKLHSSGNEMGINPQKGLWRCYACNIGGDMLDLIAQSNGLDVRRDFVEVLAIAAELVGVAPETDTAEAQARRAAVEARIAEAQREQELRAEQAAQDRAEAESKAAALWEQLPTRSAEGERYLATRGLLVFKLQLGAVRFMRTGPAVTLRSFDGEIVNVVTRRYPHLGDPKTRGLFDCRSEGTLVGSMLAIGPRSDVVVCEGVMDALTATMAWPHAVVLGAHAALNLKAIAACAARRVRAVDGRLFLIADCDSTGTREGLEAARAVRDLGLRIDRELHIVDIGDAKDLNAAWQAGWRP